VSAEEEARAAAYRAQELRRVRFMRDLNRQMRGSEAAKRALIENYAATLLGKEPPLIWEDVAD